jgi:hypothetical protein
MSKFADFKGWPAIQALTGLYCALFTTWSHFHPYTQPQVPPAGGQPGTVPSMIPAASIIPLPLWLGLMALFLSVMIPACIQLWKRLTYKPTLVIHSAYYGTGPATDFNVTDIIRKASSGESLALWIDNNAFGKDPHISHPKELKVQYSYGNDIQKSIIRPENSYLILPEDEWLKNLYLSCRRQLDENIGAAKSKPQFTILKADWGNVHSIQSVADIIPRMSRNALTFYVNHYAFSDYDPGRPDPAPGTAKYLEVTYSWPGREPQTIRRNEGEWIVLPEDPVAKAELQRLSGQAAPADIEAKLQELSALQREKNTKQEREAQIQAALDSGPFVTIVQSRDDGGYDKLSFENIRDRQARKVKLGPLRITNRYSFDATIPNELVVVDRRNQTVPTMRVRTIRGSLGELIMIQGKHLVTVAFEDDRGYEYEEEFELLRHEDGTIEWKPGALRLG